MKHLKLFFALFAMLALGVGNAWAETYELVTSISDLEAGAKYIVGNSASTSSIFMSTATNTNNRKVTSALTITDNKVTITEDVLILELGGETGAWTFKTTNYLGTQGFLTSAASGKNNHCKVVATAESCSYFTIAFNDQEATITSTGRNERNILRYNSSNGGLFACYSSGQDPVYLYKLTTSSGGDEGGTEEPVLSATPTEIDFGTVYQGTTVEDKTVAVNFENLTGAVTYSGLSTPFTATGAISATGDKITISADASTIGERSQTLTIQSAADSKTAEVTVRINVEAPFNGKELGFDFVNHPTGWPIKSNATAGEYVYNLDDTDYTFKHSKSGDGVYVAGTSGTSGYLLIASGNTLGLPAIKGHKLVKVQGTLNNSGSPSTLASVSITDGTNTLSGGTAQTWNTKGGIYTYSLSGTQANTMYYLSVSNKNLQMITLVLYYEECEKYALTITEPAVGTGTLLVKDGENTLTSGAEIYEGTKLTVTATPAAGYEEGVVVVKNASDEDVTADVYDAGTLTMPAYAVTISATFEKKPCTLLTTPVVTATPTYNSATLTWAAVANATKYSVTVGETTTEVTEPTYTATGLNAETTYTYQVQAIAEAEQDTYCNSEVAEGSFTTTAAPVATLTLSDIEGTTTKTGALNGTITLPTTAAECSKTFVGWDADENCDHAPTYAPGAEYTFTTLDPTLYAVYADGEGGGDFTITKTMSEIVAENEYTVSEGSNVTCYTSLTLDENITLSTTGEANCGSFWRDPREWRLYQNKSGNAIVTASNGFSLTSVKFTFTVSEGGTLLNDGIALESEKAVTASGTSVTYLVGDTKDDQDKGQVRITAIEVSYSKEGEYSNYSTTCEAAPIATIDPTSVTATAAGAEGKVTVIYENVNTASVSVALFNDAACTEAFTAGWLTADLDGDKNIAYTVAENTTYAERKAYIQLTAPDAAAATDPDVVVIPVTQAGKDKVFASLEALLAAITPTTEGVEVTVTLTNELIVDFYTSSSSRNGIALNVPYQGGTKQIEIYCKDVPAEWVKGGKVSGTITCPWKLFNSTWELCPAAWTELTYTAPATVKNIAVSGTPTKTTYVDGEAFDPTGLVVTATLTDDSTEPIDVALVDWTFDPETLSKGETSVSVVATYNTMASAPYEVTGLTVNDIPDKTVAEFIEAGGTRCYLEGIVSNITNTTYGNFDLTDESGTIYVYGCLNGAGEEQKFADLGVKNGDKIKVIADEYELYGGTKDEAKNVQYVSHVSAASITISDITMEVEEVATITATVDPADAVVTYTIKENAANAISLEGNTITALAEGTATITATVAEGANYLGNSVDFTVTVGPKTESDEVVILAEYNGQWYALKAAYPTDQTDRLDAVPVNYVGGKLYNVADDDKAAITWTRTVVDAKTTFKNGNNYISAVNSGNLKLSTTECSWGYNSTLNIYMIEGSDRTFIYRAGTVNAFRNYDKDNAGTADYSSLPVVTAPVYATGDAYGRTVTTGEYGTICIPYGSSNYTGAEFYEISWMEMDGTTPKSIWLDEVNGALTAGKPYIFKATADEIAIVGDGTTAAIPVEGVAGLTGTFTLIQDIETSDPSNTLEGNYLISGNQFLLCPAGCWLNANRAYIDASIIANHTTEKAEIPGRRRVCLGETSENEATGFENIVAPEGQAVKAIVNGQLIIIRDGVKYNVQGQKL